MRKGNAPETSTPDAHAVVLASDAPAAALAPNAPTVNEPEVVVELLTNSSDTTALNEALDGMNSTHETESDEPGDIVVNLAGETADKSELASEPSGSSVSGCW